MPTETGDATTPSEAHIIDRSASNGPVRHPVAIAIRTGIACVLAFAALVAGLAWAANWTFALAALQTVRLAEEGDLRGVTWEVSWPDEEGAAPSGWIKVVGKNASLGWWRMHAKARVSSSRYFYGGPWPAGIQSGKWRRPYKRRLANGSTVSFWGWSLLFFELPLWGITVVLGAYPVILFYRGPIQRSRWRKRGLCLRCGYDLTGNKSGVCPECGNGINNE